MTFAAVRALALALPEAEEGTSYRTPAFEVRGKLFARLREAGDALVVKIEVGHREALIRTHPTRMASRPTIRTTRSCASSSRMRT